MYSKSGIMDWLHSFQAFADKNRIIYFIAAFFVLMLVEWWVARRRHHHNAYEAHDTRANLLSGTGSVVVGAMLKMGILAVFVAVYELSPLRLPADHWGTWVLAVFALDCCHYWAHRYSHETRIGWATHVTHHSSQHYNLSVALRQSWTLNLMFFFYLPLPLLGIPIHILLVAQTINTLYQFWIHTEQIDRMPAWFEFIFNTPSHHRVHHSSNPQYLDKNYAGIFILWDRIFGTFEPEVERPIYGITKNIESHNVFYINFHEWRDMLQDAWKARTWADRMGYLLNPPGWQPGTTPHTQANAPSASPSQLTQLTTAEAPTLDPGPLKPQVG
jgi:sterol desaturase/sphingolipid hydroxylase (fatty acid hydroxylase superfamily)